MSVIKNLLYDANTISSLPPEIEDLYIRTSITDDKTTPDDFWDTATDGTILFYSPSGIRYKGQEVPITSSLLQDSSLRLKKRRIPGKLTIINY